LVFGGGMAGKRVENGAALLEQVLRIFVVAM
jgi:hypothetical protein